MVMMLNKSCCGCSLKTGAIIIGVLDIVGGLGYLITGIKAEVDLPFYFTVSQKVLISAGAVLPLFGAILLVVSNCLIIGARKGNPALLVPWLVYTIVFLIKNTIPNIVSTVQYFVMSNTYVGAGYIIGTLVYALLGTYFLLVVYSLYRELKGTAPPNCV